MPTVVNLNVAPPGIPQEMWDNPLFFPPEFKQRVLAAHRIEDRKADGVTASAPVVSAPQGNRVSDWYYGTPEEQSSYRRQQERETAGRLPGAPGVFLTAEQEREAAAANGRVPLQQPGFQAERARRQADILGNVQGNIDEFDTDVRGRISGLESTYSGLNSELYGARDQFLSELAGIQLAPVSLASSNPADVARQQQTFDMLMGAAGGSLDGFSNPQDVARQQQTFDLLMGAATGAMDAHTNPEDLAAQQKARDLLWTLAESPELTAQERFIYERQRLIEEQDRRGAMDAALRNLASRGQLGSGHEIGAMLGAQQTTSQNRLLGDLGALANAVDRQMNAMGQYSSLATAMRNASDAMTSGNMDRRMAGAQGASNTATNMRNASDAMTTSNMNRRLGAMEGASSTATAMRNASDDIARFNAHEMNGHNQFAANFERQKAQAGFDARYGVNTTVGNRAGEVTRLGVDAAGNRLNAKNLIPTLNTQFLGQDVDIGLGIAKSEQDEEWRRKQWERDQQWRDQDIWAADMDRDQAIITSGKQPFSLLNPGSWL